MKLSCLSGVYSTPAIYKAKNTSVNQKSETANAQASNSSKQSTPAFGAAYPRFCYHPDLIEVVKDNSRNDEKRFDMHFARMLCSALTAYPEAEPPVAVIADELKHFLSLDKEHETDVLTGFSNTLRLCPIQKESQDFEELFPLSFNEKTNLFDKNSNELLCEMLKETYQMPNKKDVIKQYFQQVKDEETGEIKKGFTYPKQYVSELKK